MKLTATIELNKIQVLELITQALAKEGFAISHQDIHFIIETKEHGNQRDSWTTHELTGIKINNVQMNAGKDSSW